MQIQDPEELEPELSEPEGDEEDLFEHHRLVADIGQSLIRVDVFLSNLVRNTSRTRIKNAALSGCIRVNDLIVKPSYKVKPGDSVTIVLPHPPPPKAEAEPVPFDIFYEDEDIILVNKTPGMVVHPGVGNYHGTLVQGLLYHFKSLPLSSGSDHEQRPGLVHRIDKDTSGLLVIAKTEYALTHLSRQFYEHTCERTYHLVVWGVIKENEGVINANIGRSLKDRKLFQVYPGEGIGRNAITHYKVIERFEHCTYLSCTLETGRTHQIRVHMKSIGHVLFGDINYGGNEFQIQNLSTKQKQFYSNCLEIMPRQALHAKTLGFEHPGTGNKVFFDSELPDDFQKLLQKLRSF